MLSSNVASIQSYLSSRNANGRKEWIEFLLLNLPTNLSQASQSEMENWIWEQFLQADLSQTSNPSLGMFCKRDGSNDIILQIEEVLNISQSMYCQTEALEEELEGLKGRLISNEEDDSNEELGNAKSLFKYVLTDGFECICCILQESLTNSSFVLSEGYKVLISTSNVLYFEEENLYLIEKVKILSERHVDVCKKEKLKLLKLLLDKSKIK